MARRGVHFALTPEQDARLLAASGDDAVMEVVQVVEDDWDEGWLQESDKAWFAIDRALRGIDDGPPALIDCVLGGRALYGRNDYVVRHVDAVRVRAVALALAPIDEALLRKGYERVSRVDYPDHSEADFRYTWSWFGPLRAFYQRAAGAGRAVIFTVDT